MSTRPVRGLVARLAGDPLLWLAVGAGPLAWGAMVALGKMTYAPGNGFNDLTKLLIVVAAFPIAEEMLFRGVIQPAIADRISVRALPGISAANWLTSMAFGAAHLIAHPPAHAFATILPSLVFGFFRDRTASVVPGIALHVWYNAGWFLLLAPRTT